MKTLETKHNRITNQILKCLEEVVAGKITQLIPKENLMTDLFYVEKLLGEDQKLPIDFTMEDPLHIFKFSKIVSTLYGNRILLEIVIPIIERERYTAYEIIPIPITIRNKTKIIKPTTRYILLNDNAKDYIPITSVEYMQSVSNLCGEKIIKPAENAHLDFTENCEINILMHPQKELIESLCDFKTIQTSNYFISINSNNLYFLHVVKKFTFLENCRHSQPEMHKIERSGLLTLDRDCRVNTNKISLRPRANYNYDSANIIVMSNRTISTKLENIFKVDEAVDQTMLQEDENILVQDHSADFDELIKKAEKLIEESERNKEWNDIRRQNMSDTGESKIFTLYMALIFFVIVSFILGYVCLKFLNLQNLNKTSNRKKAVAMRIFERGSTMPDYYNVNGGEDGYEEVLENQRNNETSELQA